MFRATIIVCFMLAASPLLQGQSTAQFTSRLQQKINNSSNSQQIEISILLSDRVDIRSLDQQLYAERATLSQRAETVMTALKHKAASTQAPLLEYLRSTDAVFQQSVKSFWVTNVIFCSATTEVIQALVLGPDVNIIDLNVKLILDEYVVAPNRGAKNTLGGHEPGHDALSPTMCAKGITE